MAVSSDVIFLDTNVLLATYADLGIRGLDGYADRAGRVFLSEELRLELRDAAAGSSAFNDITQWLDSLSASGRAATVSPITDFDRARYNPSGKNDGISGEKFDISVRKFMDLSPSGLLFEVISDDVGLLSNQHLGQPIVDVNFKPTTLEMEMLDRASHHALSFDEFEVVSGRNYANVPGFQASIDFPSPDDYRATLSVHTFDNLLRGGPDALILLVAAPPLMGLLADHAEARGLNPTNVDHLYQMAVDLGLQANYETFRSIASSAATEAGITVALGPVGMARKAFQLLLSGEDVMDVIKLYELRYPDDPTIGAIADAARALEGTAAWQSYKDKVGSIQDAVSWFTDTVLGRGHQQAVDTAFFQFATNSGSFNTLEDSLAGTFGLVPAALEGTAFAHFLPSTLLAASGGLDIAWDWSNIDFNTASYAASVDTSGYGFNYVDVPGISVTSTGGDFTGTFAQTSDGIPIWQVASSSYQITQTAVGAANGGLTVITNHGGVTGQFNYSGAVDTAAGPLSYFEQTANLQLQNFTFTDNATGEAVGEGIIVGGEGVDRLGGDVSGDTFVSRTRDATTGEWQTTVTTPRHGLTPAQQAALMEQAALNQIDFNLQNYELAGGEIGQIFGSSLGQAMAGDNVFVQVASSTVLGTLLRNLGETWGRSVTTGESLLDAAIGDNGAFNDFDQELGQNFQQQALGAVSGFLLGELAESLGFDGAEFGDQLFRASAGSLASTVANNALLISQGSTTVDLFSGVAGNLATGIGSFIGGYIAREIVAPETRQQHAANDDVPWTDVRLAA